jgi:hypothetical protein
MEISQPRLPKASQVLMAFKCGFSLREFAGGVDVEEGVEGGIGPGCVCNPAGVGPFPDATQAFYSNRIPQVMSQANGPETDRMVDLGP